MQRRECLLTSAALAVSVVGCIGVEAPGEDDTVPAGDDRTPTTDDGDDDGANVGGGDDGSAGTDDGDGDQDTADDAGDDASQSSSPVGFVPESAIHQWAFVERDDATVEDAIGGADGTASDALESVDGAWAGDVAEYAPAGFRAHIDIGHLESINDALNDSALTLFATVNPTEIPNDRPMTILGAGGGASHWLEFRLSTSTGGHRGYPILYVRDDRGDTVQVAGDHVVETDTPTRLAVSMQGESGTDVRVAVNGRRVDSILLENDRLHTAVAPSQSYGIFASNPQSDSSIGTRRFFAGTIDNVIVCHGAVSPLDIERDYAAQPWAE